MLICPPDIFSSTIVGLLGQVFTLKDFYSAYELQTTIACFINQKEKHVSIRCSSIMDV